jgi:tRNA/rRNA methyltransferase
LVEPQLGENIGTAARAMANFGLNDLRLVKPRDGWPNPRAKVAASRADHVLEAAQVFESLGEAVSDLGTLFAATARAREIAMPVLGPESVATSLWRAGRQGIPGGVLFGRERTGLTNQELGLCEAILTFPVDPAFSSLNVAQAVLLFAYEWRRAGHGEQNVPFSAPRHRPADKGALIRLFEHFESALDTAGFFRPPEKRAHMVQSLRAFLQRASLSDQEVRTLRGAIAALENRPTRPRMGRAGTVSTARSKE